MDVVRVASITAPRSTIRPTKSDRINNTWTRAVVRPLNDRRIRFLLAGALNTGFGYGAFVAAHLVIGVHFGYMWALLTAHTVSVLFAFTVHRCFTFRVHGTVLRDLWRFECINLTALGTNALVLPLLVEVFRFEVLLAQAITVGVTATVSWFGHSRFTFLRTA